ncbi:MAG: hypothetical protein IRZ00_06280 [Gemmatimonadetes bacterium]|nr:hypothetical protein [Gemmatimonadota bacterium]
MRAYALVPALVAAACAAAAAAPAVRRRAAAPSPADPTFAADVAPILYRACVGCHRPGGSAPFSLLTYEDARVRADKIAAATARRAMPPWLPEPGYGRFIGERRLSEAEIATLRRWADIGAPPGDTAHVPAPPPLPEDGWRLGEPDIVVELPALDLPPRGPEAFRNLVVAAPVQRTVWVRAVALLPGAAPRVVHHARLMVDTTASSRTFDAADPEPGFGGMDVATNATNPEGFFVGWTPGKVDVPDGSALAWPLRPGTDLVLQLHLRTTGRPERVQPRIGLYLAPAPPTRRPSIVMLGSESIDIPAGDSAYVVADDYRLPVAVDVLGLYPHAHYLAREMLAWATLPDGRRRWLLRIPEWDFNWQDEYRYAEPVHLPAGSVVSMRFTYDNSAANPRNPNRPPRRVKYGPTSMDEMGDLVVQVLAASEADRRTLEHDIEWGHEVAKLERRARDASARADTLAAAGRLDEALALYREAVRLVNSPRAMAAMARILVRRGDVATAVLAAERAAALTSRADPRILDALAAAYRAAGRTREAAAVGREAVRIAERAGERALADSLRAPPHR